MAVVLKQNFPKNPSNPINSENIPFWRDERVLKIVVQVFVIGLIIALLAILGNNLVNNFQRLGLSFGLGFLFDSDRPASFRIGDSPIPYRATDPYYRAILVGLLNSLRVMITGIILATGLGITVGIGRLSDNWLVRQIAGVYVEIFRNTPLLLQLFFWYFAVFLKLPKIDNPVIWFQSIFLSNQGIYLPFPQGNLKTSLSLIFIIISLIFAVILWRRRNQVRVQRGTAEKTYSLILGGMAIAVVFALIFGLDWQFPEYDRDLSQLSGGLNLSPEFATLLIGLTMYTAAFIAEVVRAGIQSVSQGQWEAGRSLGLNSALVMRLVIFPQALRVMIPPLTSEYLNLAKNSSLAVAIGYNDVYAITNTVSNQTGKAVEMLVVVMGIYLLINLIIAIAMNGLNRSVQIKER